ncbi:MAG: epimerase [Paracoccaceae bacterium]
MARTVLVLGANGRFGLAAKRAFSEAGWEVKTHRRGRDNLWDSAWGAEVIVNAWNPPYQHWARDLPGLTEEVIAVAKASGATVILPGNVYVYGKGSPELLCPDTPHRATNTLGRLRIEMEAAYRASGVRTIILRGGDFIDTAASGNWFDKVIVAPLRRGRITYPARFDLPRAWAFLPDMARATVMLAERRASLPAFVDLPFAGYTLTAAELCAGLSEATGRSLRLRPMAWWPIQALTPFWPLARHLVEMRYLWDMPHRLDSRPLAAVLPDFVPTPVVEALALAVEYQIDPDQPVARRRGHHFGKRVTG